MWIIRDADSTIYITGTVHLLPDDISWRSEKLDAALKDATEIFLELAEIGAPEGFNNKVLSILEERLVWDGGPLSSLLSENERELLDAAYKAANTPADQIAKAEKLQPWYAVFLLGREQYVGGAFSLEAGIDMTLARMAAEQGDAIKGMEEIEDQLDLSKDATSWDQLAELRMRLSISTPVKESLARVARLAFSSWAHGETNMIEALTVVMALDARASGQSIDPLLLDRNEKWAAKIEEMLKGSGVALIAVGAGHLVGPDSLQQRLKLRGIETQRY